MTDIQTEYGVAREQHIAAARRIFDDMVKRSIERQVLIQRATRIESLSSRWKVATQMDANVE